MGGCVSVVKSAGRAVRTTPVGACVCGCVGGTPRECG